MSKQNENEKAKINDILDAWAREGNAAAQGEANPAKAEQEPKTALQKAVDAWAKEKSNS